jgi:hypothetical protein
VYPARDEHDEDPVAARDQPGPASVEPPRGRPVLETNIMRRVDFALLMVEALENDDLVHEAPAIVGRQSPSALAHAAA